MKIIYLDLDGVCTNFIKSAIYANNLNYEKTVEKWKSEYIGVFEACKVFGISNKIFWENIEKNGESFWADMETYSWFDNLYNSLKSVGEVFFLTSPSLSPYSLSGKLKWMQKKLGKNFKNYIITPNKHLLASKNSYLIDDYPKNIEKFNNAGGNGILFPQYWNCSKVVVDKTDYIMKLLI